MAFVEPVTLALRGVRRVPLELAHEDGLRAAAADGTIRDTVMYSMRSGEWPEARAQLLYLLDKRR